MKTLLLIFVITVNSANAQNWQEWTQQKKTQIKYLLKQIAANKVYIEYMQKGYSIANKGLATIRNIKNGDYCMHRDFLGSLKTVNPRIKNWSKIADIIALQSRIVKESRQSLVQIREVNLLTPDELSYCSMVFDNLLEDCLKNINELFLVITPGELSMRDDERMKRIDILYTDMQNKYAFCSSFGNEMGELSIQRIGEQMEIKRSKLINGMPR